MPLSGTLYRTYKCSGKAFLGYTLTWGLIGRPSRSVDHWYIGLHNMGLRGRPQGLRDFLGGRFPSSEDVEIRCDRGPKDQRVSFSV